MRNLALMILCSVFPLAAMADPAATPAPSAQQPPTAAAPSKPTQAAQPAQPAAKTSQVDENSAAYVDGYSDGCASANLRYARQAHVKPNRDAKLYDSDNDYHEGWDHGYRKCEDRVTPGARPIMGSTIL